MRPGMREEPRESRGERTRERILDAADRLFGAQGFGATSMRALTRAAGVNLAAVHYHFGSKEELLVAALSRHLAPINAERLARLDVLEQEAGGRPIAIEAILGAFCRPIFEFSHASAENASVVQRVAALVHSESTELVRPVLEEIFHDVVERFVAALGGACPQLSRDDLMLRLHLCVGSLTYLISGRGPFQRLTQNRDPAAEAIAFLSAGFRAPRPDATIATTARRGRRA